MENAGQTLFHWSTFTPATRKHKTVLGIEQILLLLFTLHFSLSNSLSLTYTRTLSLTITPTLSISITRTHTLTHPTFIRKVHNEIILDVTEVVRNEFKLSRFLTNQKTSDFFSDTFIRIQILPKKITKKVSDPTASDVTQSRCEVLK